MFSTEKNENKTVKEVTLSIRVFSAIMADEGTGVA